MQPCFQTTEEFCQMTNAYTNNCPRHQGRGEVVGVVEVMMLHVLEKWGCSLMDEIRACITEIPYRCRQLLQVSAKAAMLIEY